MTEVFALGEVIKFGWEKMKKHFWFFVGLLILVWLIQIVPTGMANVFRNKMFILYVIFILAAWVLQIIVKMGLVKITLDVVDEKEAKLNTLFSCTEKFFKFLLASILYGLIVMAGLILFIIPGIIWMIKYQFFVYLIIDKNLRPLEAIKKSGEITYGNKVKLFWLGILFFLINMAGFICLLVGLFATIPTTMVAMAYVYRKLMGEIGGAVVSEPVIPMENATTEQPAV